MSANFHTTVPSAAIDLNLSPSHINGRELATFARDNITHDAAIDKFLNEILKLPKNSVSCPGLSIGGIESLSEKHFGLVCRIVKECQYFDSLEFYDIDFKALNKARFELLINSLKDRYFSPVLTDKSRLREFDISDCVIGTLAEDRFENLCEALEKISAETLFLQNKCLINITKIETFDNIALRKWYRFGYFLQKVRCRTVVLDRDTFWQLGVGGVNQLKTFVSENFQLENIIPSDIIHPRIMDHFAGNLIANAKTFLSYAKSAHKKSADVKSVNATFTTTHKPTNIPSILEGFDTPDHINGDVLAELSKKNKETETAVTQYLEGLLALTNTALCANLRVTGLENLSEKHFLIVCCIIKKRAYFDSLEFYKINFSTLQMDKFKQLLLSLDTVNDLKLFQCAVGFLSVDRFKNLFNILEKIHLDSLLLEDNSLSEIITHPPNERWTSFCQFLESCHCNILSIDNLSRCFQKKLMTREKLLSPYTFNTLVEAFQTSIAKNLQLETLLPFNLVSDNNQNSILKNKMSNTKHFLSAQGLRLLTEDRNLSADTVKSRPTEFAISAAFAFAKVVETLAPKLDPKDVKTALDTSKRDKPVTNKSEKPVTISVDDFAPSTRDEYIDHYPFSVCQLDGKIINSKAGENSNFQDEAYKFLYKTLQIPIHTVFCPCIRIGNLDSFPIKHFEIICSIIKRGNFFDSLELHDIDFSKLLEIRFDSLILALLNRTYSCNLRGFELRTFNLSECTLGELSYKRFDYLCTALEKISAVTLLWQSKCFVEMANNCPLYWQRFCQFVANCHCKTLVLDSKSFRKLPEKALKDLRDAMLLNKHLENVHPIFLLPKTDVHHFLQNKSSNAEILIKFSLTACLPIEAVTQIRSGKFPLPKNPMTTTLNTTTTLSSLTSTTSKTINPSMAMGSNWLPSYSNNTKALENWNKLEVSNWIRHCKPSETSKFSGYANAFYEYEIDGKTLNEMDELALGGIIVNIEDCQTVLVAIKKLKERSTSTGTLPKTAPVMDNNSAAGVASASAAQSTVDFKNMH